MKTNLRLPINVRLEANELSFQIREIEERINEEIRARYEKETSELKDLRRELWEQDKSFRETAKKLVDGLKVGTHLKIECSAGSGEKPRHYIGKLLTKYSTMFTISETGGNRSIGYSCLESIEILYVA